MPKPKTPAPYEVGYGKPPKTTQFKPGVSGNPKGRPKKAPNLEELLEAEVAKVVTLTLDGAPTKLSQGQVVIKSLMRKAMGGDLQAARIVLMGWQALPKVAETATTVTQDELALLKELVSVEAAGDGGV